MPSCKWADLVVEKQMGMFGNFSIAHSQLMQFNIVQPAYGAGLPLPFNYLIVWRQRRSIMQRMASMTADKVLTRA